MVQQKLTRIGSCFSFVLLGYSHLNVLFHMSQVWKVSKNVLFLRTGLQHFKFQGKIITTFNMADIMQPYGLEQHRSYCACTQNSYWQGGPWGISNWNQSFPRNISACHNHHGKNIFLVNQILTLRPNNGK